MEELKYFEVRKEVLQGKTKQFNVLIDGTPAGDGESDGEEKEIVTGFIVIESRENGVVENFKFYPVETNMEDYTNNEYKVLEKIIEEHEPTKWQNHEW